jgi:hypothetical protein
MSCGSCKDSIIRVERIIVLGANVVTANVPSLLTLSTLMMEAKRSSETSVLARTAQRHIQKMVFFIIIMMKTSNLNVNSSGLG